MDNNDLRAIWLTLKLASLVTLLLLIVGTPIAWYPQLERATRPQREKWRLIADGEGVHWPDIDEDLSLEGMLAGRRAPALAR